MERSPQPRTIESSSVKRSAAPFAISSGVSGLAVESTLSMEINGVPVGTLVCLPESIEELVIGWAFSHGFLESKTDINRVRLFPNRASIMLNRSLPGGQQWQSLLTAGFDSGSMKHQPPSMTPPPRDEFVLEARFVMALASELQQRFSVKVGDADLSHVCASDGRTMIVATKDIGRHNAMDKLIGWSLLSETRISSFVVAVSGKLGASIVHKATRADVRVLLSEQRPTAQAVKMAQAAGITIIGNAFDDRRTIFTHPWRINRSGV